MALTNSQAANLAAHELQHDIVAYTVRAQQAARDSCATPFEEASCLCTPGSLETSTRLEASTGIETSTCFDTRAHEEGSSDSGASCQSARRKLSFSDSDASDSPAQCPGRAGADTSDTFGAGHGKCSTASPRSSEWAELEAKEPRSEVQSWRDGLQSRAGEGSVKLLVAHFSSAMVGQELAGKEKETGHESTGRSESADRFEDADCDHAVSGCNLLQEDSVCSISRSYSVATSRSSFQRTPPVASEDLALREAAAGRAHLQLLRDRNARSWRKASAGVGMVQTPRLQALTATTGPMLSTPQRAKQRAAKQMETLGGTTATSAWDDRTSCSGIFDGQPLRAIRRLLD
mmetsp:Transcript_59792/g.142712  ORF Transcript_59792/g.142712 Transcript_59792/m.142712 type:complete len:346 (+) Transcript_59792:62-1099(+)